MDEKYVARFWSRVQKTPGCWLWMAGKIPDGYGSFWIGKRVLAHRFSFFLEHGRWPIPMALHTCDTPACVKPGHLFEGTQTQNMEDMMSKGRKRCAIGIKHHRAKLSEDAVRRLRREQEVTHELLAKKYGISEANVSHVLSGRTWRHVLP